MRLRVLFLPVLLAIYPSPEASARPPVAPIVIQAPQLQCLLSHLDKLAISKRGNVVDISACPPTVVLGSWPIELKDRYLKIGRPELACLRKLRAGVDGIALRRPDDRVALYLNPCGGR